MEELKRSTEENGWPKKAALYVSSKGGDMDVAFVFYDFVRASGLHLITIAENVQSASVILFLAGQERYASQFSLFLIHDPALNQHVEVTIRNVRNLDRDVALMHEQYLNLLIQATGLSKKEINRLSKKALPFGAERAKELGIAHHIF
jgi:ATP-dependent protease ClpP protease subunit